MRLRPDNVPDDALCIYFTADNGKSGEYWVWNKITNRFDNRRTYYWYALGNQGEEESGYDATLAARNWIRDGVASSKQ